MALEICRRLAGGESLRAICRSPRLPNISTILAWLFDGKHEPFSEQYARARAAQAEFWADEIVGVADSVPRVKAAVAKARLQVDTRKWVASRLLRKKYGDRPEEGEAANPLETARKVRDAAAAMRGMMAGE